MTERSSDYQSNEISGEATSRVVETAMQRLQLAERDETERQRIVLHHGTTLYRLTNIHVDAQGNSAGLRHAGLIIESIDHTPDGEFREGSFYNFPRDTSFVPVETQDQQAPLTELETALRLGEQKPLTDFDEAQALIETSSARDEKQRREGKVITVVFNKLPKIL